MEHPIPKRNDRLRQHRLERNWRQQDLADQLETSLVTVQRWERGTHQPSIYYLTKLCALFGKSAQELGLAETSPLLSKDEAPAEGPSGAALSEKIALWTVPYLRNPHFTGREDLLAQLQQRLAPPGASRAGNIRQVALMQAQALIGLGGIGKTQTAIEYAYRARAQGRYTHTLWMTAASEEALMSTFVALASLLPIFAAEAETDQQKLAAAIIEWLEHCEQPWLLIFDNVDDLSLLQPYLPRRGNGCVLLTTRNSAVGSLASSLEVETMGIMEGTQLLLRRAQLFANASDEEIDEAGNLVVALAQFPLALDQAGTYIEETGCSVRDYLQLYQQHRHWLLARRGRQVTGYPESVATTWSLSFERVKDANPAAAQFLSLCAFLAPDSIPEELLMEGVACWPDQLQQAVADPFTFNRLLETLLAFSLVKRWPEKHVLSIHHLVQVVQKESMPPEVQRQWAERLVRAVSRVFPHNPESDVATWSQCQRYLEQAQACDTLIQEHQLLLPEAAEVLDRTGSYLRERVLYSLAEPLLRRGLGIREQLGPELPSTATSLYNLAILYWRLGKYTEAEPLYQRALRIREQQLGPEHIRTADVLYDFACFQQAQGDIPGAASLYQRVLTIRERVYGPDHPLTIETRKRWLCCQKKADPVQ